MFLERWRTNTLDYAVKRCPVVAICTLKRAIDEPRELTGATQVHE